MPISVGLVRELEKIDPDFRRILLLLFEEIERGQENTVTKTEFNELKEIVGELGKTTCELVRAQQRTETRLEELARAQQRTEIRLEELARAQQRTEIRLEELARAQKNTELAVNRLARGLEDTRGQLGGLSKSVAYGLENEAHRKLPDFLMENHQIQIKKRLVRTFISGEEINIFAQAEKDGQEMVIVGETVLRLDDVSKLKLLDNKIRVVGEDYETEIFPLIITHFAHPKVMDRAQKKGILVVQSFEWN